MDFDGETFRNEFPVECLRSRILGPNFFHRFFFLSFQKGGELFEPEPPEGKVTGWNPKLEVLVVQMIFRMLGEFR